MNKMTGQAKASMKNAKIPQNDEVKRPNAAANTAKLTCGLCCVMVVAAREPVKPKAMAKNTKLNALKITSPIANIVNQ